ncbi:MAG: M23 family metallopeptidase [Candidatus Liptonbacteria bacterium]|nr:M23 family metallopeptidase [Candidatus Liptonbacteria bacterium]
MAVFFAVAALGLVAAGGAAQKNTTPPPRGILGGPAGGHNPSLQIALAAVVAENSAAPTNTEVHPLSQLDASSLSSSAALITAPAGLRQLSDAAAELAIYPARSGDTLLNLADRFSLSFRELSVLNPELRRRPPQPGAEVILPVGGLVYRARAEDTIPNIAAAARLSSAELADLNQMSEDEAVRAGTPIIVPRLAAAGTGETVPSKQPRIRTSMFLPADGLNWGRLHGHNAVDIAAACGTPVSAVLDGTVVSDPEYGNNTADEWHGGYGRFVMIEHANGIRTRYAHLEKAIVSTGDFLNRGQPIGTVGRSGEATGCHVHFEVYGAANPFVKS